MSAHSKRPRINEVGDISAKQEEVVADAIVAPLTLLSCRVAETALIDERKYIPNEADATIVEERSELMRQLAMLDIKKNMYIEKREDELALKREETLKHMKAVGGPDSYCTDCDTFYKTLDKEDNRCSVEDCVKHVSCPKCYESAGSYHDFYDEDSGEEFEETESVESFHCWEEQCLCAGHPPRPSSGYVKCWICEKNLCNLHFEKHYDTCRREARKRCGFRRPTYGNNGKGYACVPGHCGKEITKEEETYVCYPDEGVCCTVTCKNCVDICDNEVEDRHGYQRICGKARCKLCSGECFGECSWY